MFDKIITSNEIKFNDLERKIYEFVCYLGRIIIKLIIEKQDQNIMKNRNKKKDDLLKEWIEFREETAFCEMTPQDKKYCIYFAEIAEKILKNVPKQNKKYVQKQLDQLDKYFMDYLYYWNEKYYRNGFADVIELLYL